MYPIAWGILNRNCTRRCLYEFVFGHGFDSRRLHQNQYSRTQSVRLPCGMFHHIRPGIVNKCAVDKHQKSEKIIFLDFLGLRQHSTVIGGFPCTGCLNYIIERIEYLMNDGHAVLTETVLTENSCDPDKNIKKELLILTVCAGLHHSV